MNKVLLDLLTKLQTSSDEASSETPPPLQQMNQNYLDILRVKHQNKELRGELCCSQYSFLCLIGKKSSSYLDITELFL